MAKTLVFIPGLANTARLYEAQIAALSGGWAIQVADHTKDDSIAGIAARLLRVAMTARTAQVDARIRSACCLRHDVIDRRARLRAADPTHWFFP